MSLTDYEELADYRRMVAAIYAHARQADLDLEDRWRRFCRERAALFETHTQSALSEDQKRAFSGLKFFPYNPQLRFLLPVEPDPEPTITEYALPEEGTTRYRRFGRIHFQVDGRTVSLSVYWIMGYGGGIFLPFRDLTNGSETYGGGRYLLDTIKLADLGHEGERLVVDFNYAYNPSCAYNPRWVCPLAPQENRLDVPIRAGEQEYTTQTD